MAGPLTWREVSAPNFSGSIDAMRLAQSGIDRGFNGFAEALGKYNDFRQNQAAGNLLVNAMKFGNDSGGLNGALQNGSILNGIDPSFLTPDAIKALDAHKTALVDNGLTVANTGLAGASTVHMGAETNRINQLLPGEKAIQGATVASTNAGTAGILEGTREKKTGFDQGQLAAAGAGRAVAGAGNASDAMNATLADPRIPDAARLQAAQNAGNPNLFVTPPGAVPTGAVPNGAPAALNSAVGYDWSKNIKFGADSSGKVTGDNLHPEVKQGLSTLTSLVGPIQINSTDGGVHVKGSQHYQENAADVDISGKSPEEIRQLIIAGRQSGFSGFGIGGTHLHLDMRNGPGGDPVVFGDDYKGPVAGMDIAGWQGALNGVQPKQAGTSLDQLQSEHFRSIGAANEAATTATKGLAQRMSDGTQGNFDASTNDTSSDIGSITQKLTSAKKITTKNADGTTSTTEDGGEFAGQGHLVRAGLRAIMDRAKLKGVPITWAQAGDIFQDNMHMRTWGPGNTLDANGNFSGNMDNVDAELGKIGDSGPGGRYAQNQENVKTQNALKTVDYLKQTTAQAWDNLQKELVLAQQRKIDPREIQRAQAQYVRQKQMLDQATGSLTGRGPKLQVSSARNTTDAATSLKAAVGAVPAPVDPRNASVSARLSGAFQ